MIRRPAIGGSPTDAKAPLANGAAPKDVGTATPIAYAAPLIGSYFFYLPMWGILPGVYSKYFGVSLTALAAALLLIRVFDGVADVTIGVLSDWHRSKGGSRKTWVVTGGLASVVACSFLFMPPADVTISYYIFWSLAYFLAFTIAEIPHSTWGNELTFDYQSRTRIFGFRSAGLQVGASVFYALPLLPLYTSADYTPQVLHDAIYIGGFLTLMGILWASLAVPRGVTVTVERISARSVMEALIKNGPLHCLLVPLIFNGVAYGMWLGVAYIYIDGYLELGGYFALIFFASTIWAAISTPCWLKFIERTDKATAWAVGVSIFVVSLACMFFVRPGGLWQTAALLVFVTPLATTASNIAAGATMGDVIDYAKLRFHRDLGATYSATAIFVGKVSVGVGGGLGLGIAGAFHFNPGESTHSAASLFGLKLAFIILPALFALLSLPFILRTPINRARQHIIQRRLQSRIARTETARVDRDGHRKDLLNGPSPAVPTP